MGVNATTPGLSLLALPLASLPVTLDILDAHPAPVPYLDALKEAIESALDCVQCCTSCADACLAEDGDMDLSHCIRTDLDCADVCAATVTVIARQTTPSADLVRAQVQACKAACETCAASCEEHAEMHEHCRICAQCCRTCADACDRLLAAL